MKKGLLCFSLVLVVFGFTVIAAQNPEISRETGVIEGTVTRSGTGQPLKGARVTINRANPRAQNLLGGGLGDVIQGRIGAIVSNLAGGAVTVMTDADGRFAFTGVEPGQYNLSAERDGFVRSEYGQRTPTGDGIAVSVAANQRLRADLQMIQASVISGRVTSPDGEPASGSMIQGYTYQYSNGQRSLTQVAMAQTNDLGEYRLFWLEPGEYFIGVTNRQISDSTPTGVVNVSEAREERRGARGLQVLTAALGENGGPLAGVFGETGNPFYYPGTLDPDGAVPIAVAASVEVRGIDFNLRPVRTSTVSGRVLASFPLQQNQPGGAFRGRGGPRGGQAQVFEFAVGPVQLSLTRVGAAQTGLAAFAGLALSSTPVNDDGTFEISDVAPGRYNLTATARDPNGQEHTARVQVDVGPGDVSNLTLTLRPGVDTPGRIVLDTAAPAQFNMTNIRVSLVAESAPLTGLLNAAAAGGGRGVVGAIGGAQSSSATVAEDGTFTLQNVGAMEYRIRVTGLPQGAYIQSGRIGSSDALNSPFTIDGRQPLQLTIGFSPGRVTGIVADATGAPVSAVQAVLVPDEARRGRSEAYFTANSDANGQFTLNNIPPGNYKLFAWEDIPGGAYQYPDFIRKYEDRGQPVSVGANGSSTVNARLIPAGN